MRICVSGVHGVGKSTLVNWIAEKYDLKVYPEMARHLLDTKYPFEDVNNELSVFMDFQNEVLDNQIDLLFNLEDDYVTDRSPVDSLAYVVERLGADRYSYTYYYDKYLERVARIMDEINFDLVLFLNFNTQYEYFWKGKIDGQRNLSPMYMKALNEIMLSLYTGELSDTYKFFEIIDVFALVNRKQEAQKLINFIQDKMEEV